MATYSQQLLTSYSARDTPIAQANNHKHSTIIALVAWLTLHRLLSDIYCPPVLHVIMATILFFFCFAILSSNSSGWICLHLAVILHMLRHALVVAIISACRYWDSRTRIKYLGYSSPSCFSIRRLALWPIMFVVILVIIINSPEPTNTISGTIQKCQSAIDWYLSLNW